MKTVEASFVYDNGDPTGKTNRATFLIRTAGNPLTRFFGLMGTRSLPNDHGLLITPCSSVHTFFMRYPIDIIYLDGTGHVTECVSGLKPWRFCFSHRNANFGRPRHTLELASGSIKRWGICPGDQLLHPRFRTASK